MIVIKKKILFVTCILMVILLSFVTAFSISQKSNQAIPKKDITVVIDAGHGGVDGGAVGYSKKTKESDLNLEIALKLKKYFEIAGINAVMTRSDKNGLYGSPTEGFKKRDMLKRRDIIKEAKPDLVISIHLNTFPTHSRKGAQVFFKKSSENGILAANLIQAELNKTINIDRGFEALKGDYYLLNTSDVPSVIAECGFISNPEEEQLLKTDSHQDKLAYSIFSGSIVYFNEITKLTWQDFTGISQKI